MFELNPMFPNATQGQKWEQFRLWRTTELVRTDWVMLPDVEILDELKVQYMEYRAFLRNAPQNYTKVEDIEFPYFLETRDAKLILVKKSYKVKKQIRNKT